MKSYILCLLCSCLFLFSCVGDKSVDLSVSEGENTFVFKSMEKEKLLRHMVLFKFKEETKQDSITKINNDFKKLPEAIPEIKHFEWGLNTSKENLHQDFTHCYLLSFTSKKDLDSVYTPHPAHQAFVKSLKPHIDGVFVVDYWANE